MVQGVRSGGQVVHDLGIRSDDHDLGGQVQSGPPSSSSRMTDTWKNIKFPHTTYVVIYDENAITMKIL